MLFEEDWDPYAATPEDALDTARREVKRWRLEQLTHLKANADLDPVTAFFVLAWDAFKAPVFSSTRHSDWRARSAWILTEMS